MSAFSVSDTRSVYKYREQRILNLTTPLVFLILTCGGSEPVKKNAPQKRASKVPSSGRRLRTPRRTDLASRLRAFCRKSRMSEISFGCGGKRRGRGVSRLARDSRRSPEPPRRTAAAAAAPRKRGRGGRQPARSSPRPRLRAVRGFARRPSPGLGEAEMNARRASRPSAARRAGERSTVLSHRMSLGVSREACGHGRGPSFLLRMRRSTKSVQYPVGELPGD